MSRKSLPCDITTIGIDIGKNTFHPIGLDRRGAIALQLKGSRARAAARQCSTLSDRHEILLRSAPHRWATRSPWS